VVLLFFSRPSSLPSHDHQNDNSDQQRSGTVEDAASATNACIGYSRAGSSGDQMERDEPMGRQQTNAASQTGAGSAGRA
jgi:hypothetical protein